MGKWSSYHKIDTNDQSTFFDPSQESLPEGPIYGHGDWLNDTSQSDWKKIVIPIKYRSDEKPNYLMVTASASYRGDYMEGNKGEQNVYRRHRICILIFMRGTVAILTLTLSLCLCFASNQSQAAPGPAIDSAIPQPDSSETVITGSESPRPEHPLRTDAQSPAPMESALGVRPILAQNGA